MARQDPGAPGAHRNPGGAATFEAVRALLAAGRDGPAPTSQVGSEQATGPVGSAQRAFWLVERLRPASPLHNLCVAHHLRGPLDRQALARALAGVADNHAALRTTIREVAGGLVATIAPRLEGRPAAPGDAGYLDLTPQPDVTAQPVATWTGPVRAVAANLAAAEARHPLDLSDGPVLRCRLFELGPDEHLLTMTVHHACFDGWSFEVLMADLTKRYRDERAGRAGRTTPTSPGGSDPPGRLQYQDVAAWEAERLRGAHLERLERFWRSELAGAPPTPALPGRIATLSAIGPSASLATTIPAELVTALRSLAATEGTTLFAALLAGLAAVLARYSGESDLLIGTPVAGRNRPELRQVVGPLLNVLPLRVDVTGSPDFASLVRRAGRTVSRALAHQDLPFERIVSAVNPPRRAGLTPLHQVMLALQNLPRSGWAFDGLQTESWSVDPGEAQLDLTLYANRHDGALRVDAVFRSDRFEDGAIDQLLGHYRNLLAAAAAEPHRRLDDLELLTPEERADLLAWSSRPPSGPSAAPAPALAPPTSIDARFEEQVARSPDACAVIEGDRRLTYRQLDGRANRLAWQLHRQGVGPGDLVGVRLPSGLDFVVTLLAVLKAGAAYVPVEATHPSPYAAAIFLRSGVRLVVTRSAHDRPDGDDPPGQQPPRLYLDDGYPDKASELGEMLAKPPRPPTMPDDPAYVVFTSGSTGLPKGVVAAHRGVVRLVVGTNYANLRPDQVFIQLAQASFDIAAFEVWGALLNGATLVTHPERPLTLDGIGAAMHRHRVSIAFITTGLFERLVDLRPDALAPLSQLLVGGDVLSPVHARRFLSRFPDCRLVNCYGPTEATGWATFHPVEPVLPRAADAEAEVDPPIPIGRPIAATAVYVVDQRLRLVPRGVEGDVYVGGPGVALGYLGDPAATADRFVSDPFTRDGGQQARLYRTGDRAAVGFDGAARFAGRDDDQAKVRGARVEPAEVETLLAHCPGVARVAVVAVPSTRGRSLVAFVVPQPDAHQPAPATTAADHPLAAEARAFARSRLPSHLVPSRCIVVAELPLNANGKVDRRALVAAAHRQQLPQPSHQSEAAAGASVADPAGDEVTGRVRALFAAVLGRPAPGDEADFFESGGDSLGLVELVCGLDDTFATRLPLDELVRTPTIAAVAAMVRRLTGPKTPGPGRLVAVRRGRADRRLFLVPGGHGGRAELIHYSQALATLGGDWSIDGLTARGLQGECPPDATVAAMAAGCIDELQARQPHGPYTLAGECVGGVVAHEMARQLTARGETVAALVLLDTWCPSPAGARHVRFVELPTTYAGEVCRAAAAVAADLATTARTALGGLRRPHGRRPFALTRAARELGAAARDLGAAARDLGAAARRGMTRFASIGSPYPGQDGRVERAYPATIHRHRPGSYGGRATLLVSAHNAPLGLAEPWSAHIGELAIIVVPGDHDSYLGFRETLEQLAAALQAR